MQEGICKCFPDMKKGASTFLWPAAYWQEIDLCKSWDGESEYVKTCSMSECLIRICVFRLYSRTYEGMYVADL